MSTCFNNNNNRNGGRKRGFNFQTSLKSEAKIHDGRFCVWCRFYMEKLARHKDDHCLNLQCGRALPLRGASYENNLKWLRCKECDSFIRADFNYCALCGETTATGKAMLLRKEAAQKQQKLLAERKNQEDKENALLLSIKLPTGKVSSTHTTPNVGCTSDEVVEKSVRIEKGNSGMLDEEMLEDSK